MVPQSILYMGELRCKATHGPSGVELVTDAPTDNQGRGESFSPTDLVVTALQTLEKNGVIEIVKVEPKPADAKKKGAKK